MWDLSEPTRCGWARSRSPLAPLTLGSPSSALIHISHLFFLSSPSHPKDPPSKKRKVSKKKSFGGGAQPDPPTPGSQATPCPLSLPFFLLGLACFRLLHLGPSAMICSFIDKSGSDGSSSSSSHGLSLIQQQQQQQQPQHAGSLWGTTKHRHRVGMARSRSNAGRQREPTQGAPSLTPRHPGQPPAFPLPSSPRVLVCLSCPVSSLAPCPL